MYNNGYKAGRISLIDRVTMKLYEYDVPRHEMKDSDGACVVFPWDIRRQF